MVLDMPSKYTQERSTGIDNGNLVHLGTGKKVKPARRAPPAVQSCTWEPHGWTKGLLTHNKHQNNKRCSRVRP